MEITATRSTAQLDSQAREQQIQEAARDFEALLITQILDAFRLETEQGCFGGGGDLPGATMLEFAGQHLARVISSQGGLGLQQLIAEGLRQRASSAAEAEGAAVHPVDAHGRKASGVDRRSAILAGQFVPGVR